MNTKLITIDTDNAIIRLYRDNAKEYGLTPAAILRLRNDLATLAIGVSSVSGATFRVEVV